MSLRHINYKIASCLLFVSLAFAGSGYSVNSTPPLKVVATVIATSSVPDPSTAPYADCLTYIKVKVDEIASGDLGENEILVAFWGFKNYTLSEPATYTVGDKISLSLVSYSEVESEYGELMRVDDTEDYVSSLFWATESSNLSTTTENVKKIEPEKAKILNAKTNLGIATKISQIYEVHDGSVIGGPKSQMLFGGYSYLFQDNFWNTILGDGNRQISSLSGIEEFSDYLKNRNIHLVLVFPPAAAAVYPEIATNVDYEFQRDGRVDNYFIEFLNLLKKKNIDYVDILPVLMENKWEKGPDGKHYPIYFNNDVHWTDRAALISGKAVAEHIKERKLLREVKTPAQKVNLVEKVEVAFKESGNYTSLHTDWNFPPATYVSIDIIPPAGFETLLNKENPEAPVWILGDSFMYPEFYSGLAAELGLPCNIIAYGGGSPTAVREDFIRRDDTENVQVVVWEITSSLLVSDFWKHIETNRESYVDLLQVLDTASINPSNIRANKDISIYGVTKSGIDIPRSQGRGQASQIFWEKIQLGEDPVFSANLGLGWIDDMQPDGVIFKVVVNGQIASEKKAVKENDSNLRHLWSLAWDVDLAKYRGQEVTLSLQVDPLGNWDGLHVFWGVPIIYDARIESL